MNDIELLVIGSGIVYAIGRALERDTPAKRETIRYTKTKHTPQVQIETTRPTRLTNHHYPVRVPVDTTLQPPLEPRKEVIAPRQPRTRRHTGHGPFGMNQDELKAARKYLSVGGDPVEYDEAVSNNGWLVGLSEGETE